MAKASSYAALAAASVAAGDKVFITDISVPANKNVVFSDVIQAGLLVSTGFAKLASNVLSLGPNGATNPSFTVDGATASAATGFKVTAAAAAGGVALVVTSSGTDESVTFNAKGTGTVTFNGTATGAVIIGSSLTCSKPITSVAGASTAAAGTTTADATALPAATAFVYPTTAADGTKGVRIHADDKVTGRTLFIGNGVSNQILKVYAPSGGAINGAAADAAFSSASGKGVLITCLDATANTWLAM